MEQVFKVKVLPEPLRVKASKCIGAKYSTATVVYDLVRKRGNSLVPRLFPRTMKTKSKEGESLLCFRT